MNLPAPLDLPAIRARADAVARDVHAANCTCEREFTNAAYTDVPALLDEVERLRAEVKRLIGERIVSVVFGHHRGAPRPFALRRKEDVTGISGTGVVALGVEWPDGMVVLRWTSDWPTSVVFHDRGMESVEAVHGHGGKTEVVWLSEELEPLAAMETERDAYRAVVDAAREWREMRRDSPTKPKPESAALTAAVDAPPPDGPGNGPQIAVEATGGPETDPRTRDLIASERRTEDELHVYLSTGCLHGHHDYCQGTESIDGGVTKFPAQCKFCSVPCICGCHTAGQLAAPDG